MPIKVCSVGDIMLGENVHHYGRGIYTSYQGRFDLLISGGVREALNGADLVVGNLECSLMSDKALRFASFSRSVYTAPESALECFKGFRPPLVLNLANNHFGQHGEDAMAYTVDCLRRRGIYTIGRGSKPLRLTFGRYQLCLIGVSLVEATSEGGYLKSTPERLLRDLDWGPKPVGTFRVLSIHWGQEYRCLPSIEQRKLAGMLSQDGVDLILGHHPHVVQPVRRVGKTTVAYSHGNFIFDQDFSRLTRTGFMMMASVDGQVQQLMLLQSRQFRIHSTDLIDEKWLERFCSQHGNPKTPLLMRMLMKLEMVMKAYKVPAVVWRYFGTRFLDKGFGGFLSHG
jgi:poly-gamma-glutamate synthesis protein (capsule biosynthesis protein)